MEDKELLLLQLITRSHLTTRMLEAQITTMLSRYRVRHPNAAPLIQNEMLYQIYNEVREMQEEITKLLESE